MENQLAQGGLFRFLIGCLQDIYNAEKKYVKTAAALSIAAFTEELRSDLLAQSHESEIHMERLEMVFKLLKEKPVEGQCKLIDVLSEKSADIVKTVETCTAVRDAAIIYAVQLIVHYKIACYGSLMALIGEVEDDSARLLLERSLADEKKSDGYLTQLAINVINPAAKKECP